MPDVHPLAEAFKTPKCRDHRAVDCARTLRAAKQQERKSLRVAPLPLCSLRIASRVTGSRYHFPIRALRHSILLFRGVDMTPAQHVAFTRAAVRR